MLLEIQNATVSFKGTELLSHIDFRAVDKEKIGIVGRNGIGKTTLLKLIEGEISIEKNDDETKGTITFSGINQIGFLSQITFSNLENTIEKELNEAFDSGHKKEGYGEWEREKAKNLSFLKFGFKKEEFAKKISEFSGGERTKLALIKLLLTNPDLLILDEPTNHLDIEAIEWLSSFLIDYKKTIILVSHDRQFLNDVCNVIYEVENKTLTRYSGNYDYYIDKKAIDYETKLKQYEKATEEIKKLHGLYERFRYKPTKAKMAQSKLKMEEKIRSKMGAAPVKSSTESFSSTFTPKRVGGENVLKVNDLTIGYENKIIKRNINLDIKRGDRIAIIGRNGEGKSTLLKTIVGKLKKLDGDIVWGHEIDFEYFDQDIAKNDSTKTVFDDFHDEYPNLINTDVRTKLGNFLFVGEEVFKQVCVLSGGEKVRLALCKIFEKRPNMLILDEPTNHLDILGKEALENILDDYSGTILFVSHDRYFVKRVATKVVNLSEIDNISSEICENEVPNVENIPKEEKTSSNLSFTEQKEKKKLVQQSKKLEDKIAKLESDIKIEEEKLNDEKIQTDYPKLNEISTKIGEMKDELNKAYDEWEQVTSQISE